jgi:hypothetical protein
MLLQSQKRVIAHAAVCELDAVSSLHASYPDGCSHFGSIVFNTFEAAVLLLTFCLQGNALMGAEEMSHHDGNAQNGSITCQQIMRAVEMALGRLQALASVNDQAAAGAKTLAQLYEQVISGDDQTKFSVANNIHT